MSFQYHYNLSGRARKPLVNAISSILGCPAVYQNVPSFAYRIGNCQVDKNGTLFFPDDTSAIAVQAVIGELQEQGFVAAASPGTDRINTLTIEIPDTDFTPAARDNLKKIVSSKANILKLSLGADTLPIVETEGRIAFPWFTLHGLDGEADAYSRLVAAICQMAKKQKRVTATEKPVENAKFSMRLFLIRLGFIGDEYKTARRILLRNLTGNSSWKSGHEPERLEENTASNGSADPVTPADEIPEKSKGGDDHDER